MTAYYNAPDNAGDLIAAFHSQGEADAYAAEYGGSVAASGVVFVVGRGADHERAKNDAASLAREEARKALATLGGEPVATAPAFTQGDFDAAVEAAVGRAMLARAGTTTPDEPTGEASSETPTE